MIPINLLFYLICNFFLLLIIIQFLYDFFSKDNVSKSKMIIGSLIFYAATILASNISIAIINFLANFGGIYAISLAFRGTIKKRLIISFILTLISAVSDIIAYSLFAPKLTQSGFDYSFIYTVLLLVVCETLMRKFYRNKAYLEIIPNYGLILFIIPIISLGITYITWSEVNSELQLIIVAFGLLLINLIVFHLYQIVEDNYLNAIQRFELEERLKSYSSEIEIMTHTQEQVRSMQHDIHHHIIEMKGLLKNKDIGKANTYLDLMGKAIDSARDYISSGNYEIDSLLNYLLQEAHDNLSLVDVKITIPEDLKINTFKLNTVIGNLVKNAIFAAKVSTEKNMKLRIGYDKGVLFIKIINSYSGELIKKNGEFITTKKNKDAHGIGLKNVKKIIEDSNGSMTINTDNNKFSVDILLYIDNF
ncbi:MAG: GHKL domain-containing protein [Lachnospiraceae bacterium]|nr:GHKL domain-containing protein [Lachnospiraceae bacterium]